MTVQELIDELMKVKNKKQEVVVDADGEAFTVTDIEIADGKIWIEANE